MTGGRRLPVLDGTPKLCTSSLERHFSLALSFFKRNRGKSGTAPSAEDTTPAAHPADIQTFTQAVAYGGIVVEEIGDSPQSALDEAAVLYASNQIDRCEVLLKTLLGDNDPAWLMLFDLYRILGRHRDFEQLALDYARVRETSPPLWQHDHPATTAPAAAGAVRNLALPAAFDPAALARLRADCASLSPESTVLLDFSRVRTLDPQGTEMGAQVLTDARRSGAQLKVCGIGDFLSTLKSRIHTQPNVAGYWLLLLAVYQLLGKQAEFEDTAVDYAVRFEVSPPSWEAVKQIEEIAPAAATAEPAGHAGASCVLSGVLDPADQASFTRLEDYATAHTQLIIDLSAVTRVDYNSMGRVITLLMAWATAGKTVRLRGQNSLIHPLFVSMGLSELAELEPARPR
jgi:anti-anti-sigma regulatory factor